MAKHFLALHAKLADRAGGGNAAIDIEEIVMAAVGVEPRGENALILGFLGLQYERPGAVPEQDAGGAVLPVEDAAERLRPDDEGVFGHADLPDRKRKRRNSR